MLLVCKAALGPLLLVQGRRTRRNALRLPEAAGPRDGVAGAGAPGAAPLRVLFAGDSSAAGVGVDHQHEALALPAAQALSQRLAAPVRWQLVARSGVNTAEALQLLAGHELAPADLLVTALGVNDVTSQRSPRQFIADHEALVAHVAQRTGARAVLVSGLPPMHRMPSVPQPLRWYLGQCARRLDAALQAWAARAPRRAHLSLQWAQGHESARDGYHPGPAQYRLWAERVAAEATRLLAASTLDGVPR